MSPLRPLLVLLVACQADDRVTKERLDQMIALADDVQRNLDRLAHGGGDRGALLGPQAGRPDPATVYSVPIDGNPALGAATAKITLVQAAEFACPFCLRANDTIVKLRKDYGRDLRVVWKHLVVHPQVATAPALAGCAAHKQGKFFELAGLIWKKSWVDGRMKDLSQATMVGYARQLGLDLDRFRSDMEGSECQEVLLKDEQALAALGVRGTPAFFINGRFLSGAQPIERFRQIIDEELRKADEAFRSGKKPSDYYSSIVAAGKKRL